MGGRVEIPFYAFYARKQEPLKACYIRAVYSLYTSIASIFDIFGQPEKKTNFDQKVNLKTCALMMRF